MTVFKEVPVDASLIEPAQVPAPVVERQVTLVHEQQLTPGSVARGRELVRRIATGIVPYLSHQVQYAGRVGIAGIALLVISLACFVTVNSPLRLQRTELQSKLTQAQRDQLTRRRTGTDLAPAAQLQSFVSKLPARSSLPAIMQQVIAQAGAAGIALERGSYELTVTHSGQIVRARATFPVQGSYPNIRRFVDGTLAAIPGAAVDGLKLERESIGSGDITADVRFTLFVRNEP